MRSGRTLTRSFYERPTVTVARELIGKVLVHESTTARIVETEAYLAHDEQGRIDFAAHAARGITNATRVIFGKPGYAYVYLIYGMYECLNIVAEPAGKAGCVLIRAVEPLEGIEQMRERRGVEAIKKLANGPGKLTLALGISRAHNGQDVTRGSLVVKDDGARPASIGVSPRIGIRHSADWPLRFFEAGSEFVSTAPGFPRAGAARPRVPNR